MMETTERQRLQTATRGSTGRHGSRTCRYSYCDIASHCRGRRRRCGSGNLSRESAIGWADASEHRSHWWIVSHASVESRCCTRRRRVASIPAHTK